MVAVIVEERALHRLPVDRGMISRDGKVQEVDSVEVLLRCDTASWIYIWLQHLSSSIVPFQNIKTSSKNLFHNFSFVLNGSMSVLLITTSSQGCTSWIRHRAHQRWIVCPRQKVLEGDLGLPYSIGVLVYCFIRKLTFVSEIQLHSMACLRRLSISFFISFTWLMVGLCVFHVNKPLGSIIVCLHNPNTPFLICSSHYDFWIVP